MFSVVVAFSFHVLASGDAQFAAFVQKHARDYQVDSEEYAMRLAHFNRRVADVEAHNAQPDRLWTAGVNVLADRSLQNLPCSEDTVILRRSQLELHPSALPVFPQGSWT